MSLLPSAWDPPERCYYGREQFFEKCEQTGLVEQLLAKIIKEGMDADGGWFINGDGILLQHDSYDRAYLAASRLLKLADGASYIEEADHHSRTPCDGNHEIFDYYR